MYTVAVRHEARGQRDDSGAYRFAGQGAVHVDVLARIRVVPVSLYERADVSEAAGETSIEVDESDCKSLRQESPDRALASAARADQLNHRALLTYWRLLFLQHATDRRPPWRWLR